MRSIAFTIIGFMFAINLSVGLISFIANGGSLDMVSGTYTMPGVSYSEDFGDESVQKLKDETAGAPLEDVVDAGEKILDFFSLGLYSKAKDLVNAGLYALPNLLFNVGLINSVLKNMIVVFLSFIYIEGAFELFTGKTLFGRKWM